MPKLADGPIDDRADDMADDSASDRADDGTDDRSGDSAADRGEPDDLAAAVFRGLADQDWAGLTAFAERNWAHLISYDRNLLRDICEALPDSVLLTQTRWFRVREHLRFLDLGTTLRPRLYPRAPWLEGAQDPIDLVCEHTAAANRARAAGRVVSALRHAHESVRLIDEHPSIGTEPGGQLLDSVYYQLGGTFVVLGEDASALAVFERGFVRADAAGNVRLAVDCAAEIALLHAIAGRHRASGEWLRRLGELVAERRPAELRPALRLANAIRLGDALDAPGAAAELALARAEGATEHWALITGLGVLFDLSAGRNDTWEALSRLDVAQLDRPSVAALVGIDRLAIDGARAIVLAAAGQAEAAVELLSGTIAEEPHGYWLLPLLAMVEYLLGRLTDAAAAARKALERMPDTPRACTEMRLVLASIALREGDRAAAAEHFAAAVELVVAEGLSASLAIVPAEDLAQLRAVTFPAGGPAELDRFAAVRVVTVARADSSRLTRQEQLVLAELCAGLTQPEVAEKLGRSGNTIKVHTRSIYVKLGVHDRAGMIAEAKRRGLV